MSSCDEYADVADVEVEYELCDEKSENTAKPRRDIPLFDKQRMGELRDAYANLSNKKDAVSQRQRNDIEQELLYHVDGMTQAILMGKADMNLRSSYKHWLVTHSNVDAGSTGVTKHPAVTIAADVLQESRLIFFSDILPVYKPNKDKMEFSSFAWKGLCMKLRNYFNSCLELSNGGYNEYGAFVGSTKDHATEFRQIAKLLTNWRELGHKSQPTPLQIFNWFKDMNKNLKNSQSSLTLEKIVEMCDVINASIVSLDSKLNSDDPDSDVLASTVPARDTSGIEIRVEAQAEREEKYEVLKAAIANALTDVQQAIVVLRFGFDFEDIQRYIKGNRYFAVLSRYYQEALKCDEISSLNLAFVDYILQVTGSKGHKKKEISTLHRLPRDGEVAGFIMNAIKYCGAENNFPDIGARFVKKSVEDAIRNLKNHEPLVRYTTGVSSRIADENTTMRVFDLEMFLRQAALDAAIANDISPDEI